MVAIEQGKVSLKSQESRVKSICYGLFSFLFLFPLLIINNCTLAGELYTKACLQGSK
jgi:hypothetical protein